MSHANIPTPNRRLRLFLALLVVLIGGSAVAQIQVGPPTPQQMQRAIDESPGPWATEAIALVVGRGLYIGYPDGGFGWRQDITRAEFAVVLARLIQSYGLDAFDPHELEVLRRAIEELRGDLGDALDGLAALTERVDGHDGDIAELWDALTALEAFVQGIEIVDLGDEMMALQDRISSLEDEVAGLRLLIFENRNAEFEAAIGAQQDEIDRLRLRVVALEQALEQALAELDVLRDLHARLQAQLDALQLRVEALEARETPVFPVVVDHGADIAALRARLSDAEQRLDLIDAELEAVWALLDDHEARIARLEEALLPARAAFYLNLAAFGSDPQQGLYGKITLGHDALLGAIGVRASFEYGFGVAAHNASAALTYRHSFARSDGYMGLGAGASFETPTVWFGEMFVGMNYRVLRNVGVYVEGRYRPIFDGSNQQFGGVGAGISLRF